MRLSKSKLGVYRIDVETLLHDYAYVSLSVDYRGIPKFENAVRHVLAQNNEQIHRLNETNRRLTVNRGIYQQPDQKTAEVRIQAQFDRNCVCVSVLVYVYGEVTGTYDNNPTVVLDLLTPHERQLVIDYCVPLLQEKIRDWWVYNG